MAHLKWFSHQESSGIMPKSAYFWSGLAAGSTYIVYKIAQRYLRRRSLYKRIQLKVGKRENQMKELRDRLSTDDDKVKDKRMEIVELTFDELRFRLQAGHLTAGEALQAFQWRALIAHERTNCACEFLPEATDWARELDEKYSKKSGDKPALFGVPVSVKECNQLIGHDATVGFAQFIGQSAHEDSALVTVLKQLGAVPFVTTNIPQSMMSIGSSNPIYGLTTNPYNKEWSPGGSSSGEGALIALRGSPLGIGTDVGGSVRVPAQWCGICALKPSVGRLSQRGRKGVVPGQTIVKGTAGPMSVDVHGLVWFMRAVCSPSMYALDPYVVPRPFDEQLYGDTRPLTIGYYTFDGWLKAVSACRRAVDVARQFLHSKGHKLIEITLPFGPDEMPKLVGSYVAALVPDGGENLSSVCSNDIVDPLHSYLMTLCGQSNRLRWIRSYLTNSRRSSTVMRSFPSHVVDHRMAVSNILSYRDRYIDFWRDHQLDAVICPATASLPLPSKIPSDLFVVLWWSCALYNMLDFSAGVVPCTVVTKQDEREASEEGGGEDWIERMIRLDSIGKAGMSVGVQVVSLPYKEEVCLRVMKEIQSAVKNTNSGAQLVVSARI